MDQNEKMFDRNYCLRKEAEFYANARAATDPKLKRTYEAAAREFAYRATLLKEKTKT